VPSARTRPCEEAAIQSIRVVRDCAASAKPWVLLATILASSIAYIDESIVNVALPAIETDLATSAIVVQWLINAYTLSLSSLLLIGGAAGDQFGRRRLFIIGIGIFAAASLWCGISPNVTQLISARVVQGVGAALLIPSSKRSAPGRAFQRWRQRLVHCWVGGLLIISIGAGFFLLIPC
jgi:MFS family permease